MREAAIGIITAIVAVAAFSWLRADPPRPATHPVVQVWSGETALANPVRNITPVPKPDPAEKKMEKEIDAVFEKVPLVDAIRHVKETTGVNAWVDWRALEAAGIERKAEVTLDLQKVKASVALKFILRDVGGGSVALGSRFETGVLVITTMESLEKEAVTRVYDVRDLVVAIMKEPLFPVDQSSLYGRMGPPSPTTQGLNNGPRFGHTHEDVQITEQEAIDSLVRLIQETIDPTIWRDAGGTVGAIRSIRGRLVVTQTPENHEALVNLLEELREITKP